MKYFTRKLWIALQNDNCSKSTIERWVITNQKYNKDLKKLKRNLSKRNFFFFAEAHRHGDYVINILVENKGKVYYQKETKEYHLLEPAEPINLLIMTLCPKGYYRTLKYINVRKYVFDYPSSQPLWFDSKKALGAWGYDELSRQNGYMRHEILLHSGTTLLIEFEKFIYSSKRILKN